MSEGNELEDGTCGLCGQRMIRTGDDCWHPWDVERACPPEPPVPMAENMEEWQSFFASGRRPGRPGQENFVSAT